MLTLYLSLPTGLKVVLRPIYTLWHTGSPFIVTTSRAPSCFWRINWLSMRTGPDRARYLLQCRLICGTQTWLELNPWPFRVSLLGCFCTFLASIFLMFMKKFSCLLSISPKLHVWRSEKKVGSYFILCQNPRDALFTWAGAFSIYKNTFYHVYFLNFIFNSSQIHASFA